MGKTKNETKTEKPPKVENYKLKDWDSFTNSREERRKIAPRFPILMPVNVDIVDGVLVRERMTAPDVKKLYAACRDEIPDYMRANPKKFPNPDKVFDEYIKYFQTQDGVEGPDAPTPLDVNCNRPTWLLFNLPRKNWKFSKDAQYSTLNDPDDQSRNFVKICTLDKMNCLLLLNRHRSNPTGLKFNLHVTINQRDKAGKRFKTPIIIDPGLGNGGHGIP